MHFYANLVKYERPSSQSVRFPQPSKSVNNRPPPYLSAVNRSSPNCSPSPAFVIDDDFVVHRNLDTYVMGEVKQLSSIENICSLLAAEGFANVKPTYLGGFWVLMELDSLNVKDKFMKHVGVLSWFRRLCNAQSDFVSRERLVWVDIEGVPLHAWSHKTFHKIGSRWGDVMDFEASNEDVFAHKRICIKTKQEDNILEKFKIIVKRKVYVVRAKELFVWSPIFKSIEDMIYTSDNDSDVEAVSETDFGDIGQDDDVGHDQPIKDKESSGDPFNIYPLLKERIGVGIHLGVGTSLSHPPGFTPEKTDNGDDSQNVPSKQVDQEIANGGVNQNVSAMPNSPPSTGLSSRVMQDVSPCADPITSIGLGFRAKKSWVRELCIKHRVNFLSLQKTKKESISDMEVRSLWGNCMFEFMISEAVGASGGILCAWDQSVFSKSNHTILIILWLFMGLGFLLLEGYTFTWSHPSATKMSKLDRFLVSEGLLAVFPCMSTICLDRHLSDHRPILLRDVIADYGAIPFRMFHSWMEWEGFDLMVSSVWNSIVLNDRNGMVRFYKKLQILKKEIRSWVAAKKHERRGILNNVKAKLNAIDTILDQGGVNDELLLSRMELVKQQHDLISSDARDRFQKAKVHWAVEGDENTKFFHGIMNKKRANLSVKGVMVEGEWVDDPMRVKDEFLAHFSSRFHESRGLGSKEVFYMGDHIIPVEGAISIGSYPLIILYSIRRGFQVLIVLPRSLFFIPFSFSFVFCDLPSIQIMAEKWHEVPNKNHRRSNADLTRSISKSIFVTNFPDETTSTDLWRLCQQYGTVVDVFIPNRKSRAGKRFAFVRFIKVDNVERLVGNLCTLWIGRMHFYANLVKYERPSSQSVRFPQPSKSVNNRPPPYLSAVNRSSPNCSSSPAFVIDDDFVVHRNLDTYVMWEVKQLSSIENICSLLAAEGFANVKPTYLGGFWVLMELDSLNVKDKFMKHVGVLSWFRRLCNAQSDFVSRERLVWVDMEGVPLHAWSLSETDFGDIGQDDDVGHDQPIKDKESSADPFNIYPLLKERIGVGIHSGVGTSLSHPLGFTPEKTDNGDDTQNVPSKQVDQEIANGGGSILDALDGMISVGQAMGFFYERAKKSWVRELCIKHRVNFLSLQETKKESISDMESFGEKRIIWNYILSLLSRWDGEFMVLGDFNEVRFERERMGSSFNLLGANFFNSFILDAGLVEVQLEGYTFTWSHPSATKMSKLDRFLVSEGLLAVFPCMSAICLDRHLSDHRPILLRDVIADYGAIPFRMFHSWMEWEGFDLMVSSVWNSIVLNDRNWMVRFHKKLQILKREIRSWVAAKKHECRGILNNVKAKLNAIDTILDQRGVNDELLLSRMELVKQQHDLISSDARDRFQKAKVHWAVEGDENTKFFHGIMNTKRANLSVKGVMVKGEWVDDPMRVKDEFLAHFSSRFHESRLSQTSINFRFPNRLLLDQVEDLEKPISRDEIREAVWDCGANKSHGPDGFTFEFFRKFWNIVGSDMCDAVEWFFSHNKFTRGCNSLFITLILKIHDPKFVSDYRPISLIGSLYKVVTKILARRLSSVLARLISDVQTVFLPNRQILDGPFIIDELISWCKRVKQQAMIFKVDFAKAYDSIRWEYLDNVFDAFGFGFKWRAWIKGSLLHVRAKELFVWSPIFKSIEDMIYTSDNDSDVGDAGNDGIKADMVNHDNVNDVEAVSETDFGDIGQDDDVGHDQPIKDKESS
nr:putative RNA-directed DNA polymerase, eukaryota, reverse transcriptase zinc-binding domain protein [Tanacetum cinerariifolium]